MPVRTMLATKPPVVLRGLVTMLLLVGAATGVVTAFTAYGVSQATSTVATESGARGAVTEKLYQSLLLADVAASSASLAREYRRPRDFAQLEANYEASIGQAQTALATLTALGPAREDRDSSALSTFPGRLHEYTSWVQRAFSQDRPGATATYQLLGSDSMHVQLLPAARQLHDDATRAVKADQARAATTPRSAIIAGVIMVLALVVAQVVIAKLTNRMLNVWLLIATAIASVSLVWVTLATTAAAVSVRASVDKGTEPLGALVDARTTALAAMASQHLVILAKGSDNNAELYEAKRLDLSDQLLDGERHNVALAGVAGEATLVRTVSSSFQELETWVRKQRAVTTATENGNHARAVAITLDARTRSTFDAADASMATAISSARQHFDTNVSHARRMLTGIPLGLIVLWGLSTASAEFGVWRRLKEYR